MLAFARLRYGAKEEQHIIVHACKRRSVEGRNTRGLAPLFAKKVKEFKKMKEEQERKKGGGGREESGLVIQ